MESTGNLEYEKEREKVHDWARDVENEVTYRRRRLVCLELLDVEVLDKVWDPQKSRESVT